jgi:hypothetical protein
LHGGSLRDVSEPVACRRRCRVLRQAGKGLQRETAASSGVRAGPAPASVNHLFVRTPADGRDSGRR